MCHFITLVVPNDNAEAILAVMTRHGRAATPVDNPSIRKVLRNGEHQYLTTAGHCDCGTVLAPRHDTPEAFEKKIARDVARMRRKHWSDAKITRAVEDRRKAEARPRDEGIDSLELWNAILLDIRDSLKLPYAALFLGYYSGAIETEVFQASRREIKQGIFSQGSLTSLEHGEVTVFSFGH